MASWGCTEATGADPVLKKLRSGGHTNPRLAKSSRSRVTVEKSIVGSVRGGADTDSVLTINSTTHTVKFYEAGSNAACQ